MAFGSADLLSAMVEGSGLPLPFVRVDGGAAANDWLMQFQADVLGVPVERPALVETTALGAAALAGMALGVWEGPEQLAGETGRQVFTPQRNDDWRSAQIEGWHRAVGAALAWARG